MTEGYHVLAHSILESWQALDKAGKETIIMETPDMVQRATRDIKLLVGLLDADVGIMSDMVSAYGVNVHRGDEGSPAEQAASQSQAPPAEVGGHPQKSPIAWPEKEIGNLVALGQWAQRNHGISMTLIMKEARKKALKELTIPEAKAAIQMIVSRKAQP